MKRLRLILIMALPALLPASLYAQTFRALNKLEANGYTLLGSSASVRGEFKVSTTSPSGYLLKASSGTGLATQAVFAVSNTGNTGIGTGTPLFRLHISSTAGTSGNMVVITTGTSNVIRMTGAGEIYANKYYGDASGLTGVAGDNLGNHTATQDLNMNGNAVLGVSSLTIVAPVTGPYSFWASTSASTPHLYVSTGGKVGFGVNSPDDAAHVIGQVRIDNDANTANKGCFRYNGATNELEYSNDCSGFQSFTAPSAGGWTDAGSVVRLTTLTDYVGVGIAVPTHKLHVAGSAIVTTTMSISGTGATGVTELFKVGASTFVIRADGNTGIGTAAPAARLTVVDTNETPTLTQLTQAVNRAGILVQTDYTAANYTPGLFWATSNDNPSRPKAGIWLNTTASGSVMYMGTSNNYATGITNNGLVLYYDGKVGVGGVTVPAQALDVSGNVQASGIFYSGNGTLALPAYSFTTDTNTGIYNQAGDALVFVTGAANRLTVATSSMVASVPFHGANGTAAAPAFAFNSDPDTGLYRSAANTLAFSAAASARFTVSDTQVTATVPLRGASGTAAAPGLSYSGDAATGLFLPAAGSIGFSASGAEVARLTATGLGIKNTAPAQALDVVGTMQMRRTGDATDAVPTDSHQLHFQGAYWNGSASVSKSMKILNDVTGDSAYKLSFRDNEDNEVMCITQAGNVGIGVAAPAAKLDVAGSIRTTGSFLMGLGSAAAPSFSFSGDPNTGMYSPGADQFGISTGGTVRLSATTAAITAALRLLVPAGTAAAPAYSFSADTNTGFYRAAEDQLAFVVGGASSMTITNTAITAGLPWRGPNGTLAAPAYSFSTQNTTGLHLSAAGQLDFGIAGAQKLRVTASSITASAVLTVPYGSAAVPGLAFTAEPNTGIYRSGLGTITLATLGVDRFSVGTTSIAVTVPFRGTDGTAALPSYSFTTDPDSGMFSNAANHLSFTTVGTERFRIYISSFGFGTGATLPEQQFDIAGGNLQLHREANATLALPTKNSYKVMLQGAYWNGSANTNMAMQLQNIMMTATPRYRLSVQDNAGTERFVVQDNGLVGINNAAPTQELDVTGSVAASGVYYAGNGALAGPAYSFGADVNTGIYRPGAEQLALVTAGVTKMTVVTSSITATLPIQGPAGSLTVPAYTFTGDTNTGVYNPGADQLGFVVGGASSMTISTTEIEAGLPWRGPNGTVAAPAFSFSGETGTGIHRSAASQLDFGTAGVQKLRVSASSITASVPLNVPYGTVSAPGWAFTSESNTGIYRSGLGTITLATLGVDRFSVGTTSIAVTVPWRGQNGTAAAPAFAFVNDPDSGMFSDTANHLSFATTGLERFRIYVSSFGFGTGATLPEQQFDIAGGNLQMQRIANATSGAPLQNSNKVLLQGAYWNGSASTNMAMQLQTIMSAVTPRYRFSVQDNAGVERFVVQDNGLVGVNNSAPGQALDVTGNISASGVHYSGNGTLAGPAYSFGADVNTGFYRPGAEQLALVTNGIARMTVVTSSITSTLPLQGPNGTLTVPAYTFTGDTNTGIYSPGADQLGFVVGGASSMTITTAQITAGLPWRGPNGTAALPAYSFGSDNTNGVYLAGADILGFATAGVLRMSINAAGHVGIGMLTSTQTYNLQLKNNSAAKPTSNTWTIASDLRLKKDVKPIEDALGKMLALKGVTYKWKDPASQGDMTGSYMGLIAQDVEKVFPEWVGTRPDGYKDLTISGFEGLTAEAVKELKRENEELEALLEKHGREIAKLEKLVSARR